jgi:hypothetical protein
VTAPSSLSSRSRVWVCNCLHTYYGSFGLGSCDPCLEKTERHRVIGEDEFKDSFEDLSGSVRRRLEDTKTIAVAELMER